MITKVTLGIFADVATLPVYIEIFGCIQKSTASYLAGSWMLVVD
jgi:hypothetical protein